MHESDREVASDRGEGAVREIDHPHEPHRHDKTNRDREQHEPVGHAIERDERAARQKALHAWPSLKGPEADQPPEAKVAGLTWGIVSIITLR